MLSCRRMVCLMLCLCLCLAALPVRAEETDGFYEEYEATMTYAQDLVTRGDRVLALGGGIIFDYDPAERAWHTAREQQALDEAGYREQLGGMDCELMCAAADGETLYLLYLVYDEEYRPTACLAKLDAEDAFTVIGEVALGMAEGSYPQLYGMAVAGDALVLCYWNDMMSNYGTNTLLRVSTVDASVKELGVQPVSRPCAYRDGKLLVRYFDYERSWTEGSMTCPQIMELDPMTGATTLVCTMPNYNCGGLAWDAATDTIFFADGSCVYRLTSGATEIEKCGVLLPCYGHDDSPAAVVGDRYFVQDYQAETGVAVSTTDPAMMPAKSLRLGIGYADDQVRAYAAAHPDVALEITESTLDTQAITQGMLTGESGVDVYRLTVSAGVFSSLRDKGYCLDLSGSQVLTEAVAGMYPRMTELLYRGGKLCAVPAQLNASVDFCYYPEVLGAVGLTEDDLPATWAEFFDFIQYWYDDIAPEWEDEYSLLESQGMLSFENLFSLLLSAQLISGEASGELITFNTPAFLNALSRLEALRAALEDMAPDSDGGNYVVYNAAEESEPTCLLSVYNDVLSNSSWRTWESVPLRLSVETGEEAYIAGHLSVYFVNPNSANRETAMEFLEYLVTNMDAQTRILLCPDANDPVETSYYQEFLSSAQRDLESAERNLENAAPEDAADMQDWVDSAREYLTYVEDNFHWEYTAEDIAAYRALAPSIVIATNSWASGDLTNLQNAMTRYMDGNMTAEQFVREFDRIMSMMQMENQ